MYTLAFVQERERAAEPTYIQGERARRVYVHRLEREEERERGSEREEERERG